MTLPEPIGQAALAFFQKLLGPVGEAGEFLTDKIRFYRWQSSLKTLQKAREIAAEYKLEVNEVPLKFLIPFMEKSSLEDDDSEMTVRWANLLASAMESPTEAKVPFIDILAKIGPSEVIILEDLISKEYSTEYLESSHPTIKFASHNFASRFATSSSMASFFSLLTSDSTDETAKIVCQKFMEMEENEGFLIEAVEYSIEKDGDHRLTGIEPNMKVFSRMMSFELLQSLSLVTRSIYVHRSAAVYVSITMITPTPLAFSFVTECRGDRIMAKASAVAKE